MKRIHRTSIMLGMIAVLSGLTLACSHIGKNQLYQDVRLQTSLASGSLTAKDESTTFLKQGAEKAMRGDYPGAILEYNQSLRLNPNNADVYYNRGVAYYYLNKSPEALQDFDQTIQLDPQFAEAYGNRGSLQLQQGNKPEAIQDFQQAAKLFAQQGDKASAQRMHELIRQKQKAAD